MIIYKADCNLPTTGCVDLVNSTGLPSVSVHARQADSVDQMWQPGLPQLNEDGWWDYMSHHSVVDRDEVILVLSEILGMDPSQIDIR